MKFPGMDKFFKIYLIVVIVIYIIIDIIAIFFFGSNYLPIVLITIISVLMITLALLFMKYVVNIVEKIGSELESIRDEKKLSVYMLMLGVFLGIFGNFIVSAFFEILHKMEVNLGYTIGIENWLLMLVLPLFVVTIFTIGMDRYFKKKDESMKVETNKVRDERLGEIISNECKSSLPQMIERTKKINFMEADISRLDGFLQGSYLNDSVFCYRHGYFVASIALTAMLIERALKIKLNDIVEDIENMSFKCINELCLARGILKKVNYDNSEFIRKKRNDYIHTKLEKISWKDEQDALDLINKSREILKEIFP